jgi:hypothetical protein
VGDGVGVKVGTGVAATGGGAEPPEPPQAVSKTLAASAASVREIRARCAKAALLAMKERSLVQLGVVPRVVYLAVKNT